MTMDNLRPYTATVATAVTLVGLIYLLILAFVQTLINEGARALIGPYLRTRNYIVLRLVVPIVNYWSVPSSFVFIACAFHLWATER